MIIHFRKNKDTGVRGKSPFLYSENPSSNMNKEVYKKEYTLYTDDWFESGSRFAYSLHSTKESARNFEYMDCWSPGFEIDRVYVSKRTLDRIIKSRDGRRGVRGAFISLED